MYCMAHNWTRNVTKLVLIYKQNKNEPRSNTYIGVEPSEIFSRQRVSECVLLYYSDVALSISRIADFCQKNSVVGK